MASFMDTLIANGSYHVNIKSEITPTLRNYRRLEPKMAQNRRSADHPKFVVGTMIVLWIDALFFAAA
jgi:hypothetical protein